MLARRPTYALVAFGALAIACSGSEPITPGKGARIIDFSVNPAKVRLGEEATLSWEVVGAQSVVVEPSVGLGAATGSATVRPIATTTYTLTVLSGADRLISTVTLVVEGGAPRISRFTATPLTISSGEASLLEWATTDATSIRFEPDLGPQPTTGQHTVRPTVTTTYRLIAMGLVGTTSQDVTIVVASGNQPFIRSFTATPQSVAPGETVTLAWETQSADGVTINPNLGARPPNGQVDVQPTESTVYTLEATGPGGTSNASVNVTVQSPGKPLVLRFVIVPDTIAPGGSASMSWETDNATGVVIEPGIGPQAAKDTISVSPAATTTYTLTAFGLTSTASQAATLTVAGANDPIITAFTAQPQAIAAGGSTTLTWSTANATTVDIDHGGGQGLDPNSSTQVSPTTTTTYRLLAHGARGSTTSATVEVTVSPAPPAIVRFTGQPSSITPGQSASLSWETTGATSVTIDQGVGNKPATGTAQVSPGATTTYHLVANGPGGTANAAVTVTVQAVGAPIVQSFTATPQQITAGGTAQLAWQTSGATAVRIDNGVGAVAASGQSAVSPATTTTYTLTADGPGGTTHAQATVTVAPGSGDVCGSPFEILTSGQLAGDTRAAADDYFDASSCTGFTAHGADQVYRVSLQAGDRLRASLTPTTDWDGSLYLVKNCTNIAQSCVAGQDNGNPETIDYTASLAETYYLIVDGYGSAAGTYSLNVILDPAVLPNDQCAGAIDLGRGGTFTGSTRSATNHYNPGTSGCTGYSELGPDVAYRVTLARGERLTARLSATWDAALYLVRDCAQPVTSCVAGSDGGNPEQLDFTAGTAGTYYVIVDGYDTAAGDFSLNAVISPPVEGGETCASAVAVPAGGGAFNSSTIGLANDLDPTAACTGKREPGADRVYSVTLAKGDVVEALATFAPGLDGALYALSDCASQTCAAGADQGGVGADEQIRFVARAPGAAHVVVDASGAGDDGTHDLTVATYTAETCSSAAPLLLGGRPEWVTTQGRVNDYAPGAGACAAVSATGADRVYSVSLRAGDQLRATLLPTAPWNPSLYLVTSCSDVSGSCVAGADAAGTGTEKLFPVVQVGGAYELIIDGSGASDGEGTLTATVTHGDICRDAYLVPPTGGVFRGTTTGYGAELGTGTRLGSCTNGWEQAGSDAVFRVQLAAGQRIEASLDATWDASLYLVSSCTASASTCVAGEDNGNPEVISFTNSGATARDYYLVVDSWKTGTSNSGNYTLAVSFH